MTNQPVRITERVMAYIPDDADAEQHGEELAALFTKVHGARDGKGVALLNLSAAEVELLCDHLTEDCEWRLEQAENAGDIADARADRRAIRGFIKRYQELVGQPQPTLHDGTPLVWKRG